MIGDEPEISERLEQHLKDEGITVVCEAVYQSLEEENGERLTVQTLVDIVDNNNGGIDHGADRDSNTPEQHDICGQLSWT